MEGKFSIPKLSEYPPRLPELIQQVLKDKEMTYQGLAEKLQVPVDEVLAYDDFKHAPSDDILKKLSGILGIRYSILRISAGYNCMDQYPDFYMPDGTEIDHEDLIDRIYYKILSPLPQLYKMIFED